MSDSVMMIIKTTGLQYDDRLRKECASLRELGGRPIIAALEYANLRCQGTTEEQVKYYLIALTTRRLLPHKKGLALKTLEMYVRFLLVIVRVRPSKLWLHNFEMAGLVPFCWLLKRIGFIKWLVWDQHELPPNRVLNSNILTRILRTLVKCCDSVVVANVERRDYLLSHIGPEFKGTMHVVDNLVDQRFAQLPKGILSQELTNWLCGVPYFLAQGGANPGRYLEQLVEAVMEISSAKLIVVGPYQDKKIDALSVRFGASLMEKVFFTGLVPQMTMVDYIDNALASIILYSRDTPNSRLCAPNRLYQSLCRGTPVVVGFNPPLANTVNKFGCGVVLSGDGRDVDDIGVGLRELLLNRKKYKENAEKHRSGVTWESQLGTIEAIIQGYNLRG